MIPLDDFEWIKAKSMEENAAEILTGAEREQWERLSENEINKDLESIIFHPVGYKLEHWSVFGWFLKTKWLEAMRAANLAAPVSMIELATGSSDNIPRVLAKYYAHPETRYTSVNLNKLLTAEFKRKTGDLPLKIDIIEDAAQKIEDHFGNETADAVIFEHAFNDVAEDMIAKKHGIDTVNSNWFDILPKMIGLTNEAYAGGEYETVLKGGFIRMLRSLLKILKPGSFIISYQFHYQFDLDFGINPAIWTELISTVRRWIKEENIGEEVFFDNFEPNWWLFIRKV